MKILVLSATPWNNQNSFGLSYSNIFSGIPDLQFANVYCSGGSPENEFDMVCYQVTVEALVKNLKHPQIPSGKVVANHSGAGINRTATEQARFDKARVLRWQILFWARDFIWKIGRWNTPELRNFIDDFKPDVIFVPIYFSSYLNDIQQFIHQYTKVPMIGYISDDCYTLRMWHFSPLFWLDRLWKRRKVKKTINQCELLYVISEIQKREYEKIFRPECKILTKCADFSAPAPQYPAPEKAVKLLYAGNVDAGRRQSLAYIGQAVKKLHEEGYAVQFDVYTPTPLTDKQKAQITCGCGVIHAPIPYAELMALQKQTDVLIHVEGTDLRSRLAVHQSFSTKLVDFFEIGKCIFAVGTADVASIDHLLKHDAAVVAQTPHEVYDKLKALAAQPELIADYGKKAYQCGKAFHDKKSMQEMLQSDLRRVASQTK